MISAACIGGLTRSDNRQSTQSVGAFTFPKANRWSLAVLVAGNLSMGRSQRPRPKRLAEKLLAARISLGLSQSELARKLELPELGLTQGTISNYEVGKREPSLPVLLKYARLAGVTVDTLIDDELELPAGEPSSSK